MNKNDEILEEISITLLDPDSSDEAEKECAQELHRIINEDPLNFNANYLLGLYYQIHAGNYKLAKHYFEKALSIDPNNEYADLIKTGLKACEVNLNSSGEKSAAYSVNELNFMKKLSLKTLILSKIVILFLAMYFICPSLLFSYSDIKISKKTEYNKIKQEAFSQKSGQNQKAGAKKDYINLAVNPTSSYNFLTKSQIYNLRTKYVKKSIFSTDDYKPNQRVFGRIVDKKPWWGENPCSQINYSGDYHERIEGNSKVSAMVNNPNALVGISLAYSPWEQEYNRNFCASGASSFLPTSLSYNPKEKIIVATYKVPWDFYRFRANINGHQRGYPLQLSGLNALDFGFKYVYVLEMESAVMMYQNGANAKDEVKVFADYLHLGSSCAYSGGCNNISPMQQDKMFTVNGLPAELTLKLWKEKPMNKFSKADFYFKMIIEGEN